MKYSLSAFAVLLFVLALVAWFQDPSRKLDWISLFGLSLAVAAVDFHLKDVRKRLDRLENPKTK
jgi:hypothetical protein